MARSLRFYGPMYVRLCRWFRNAPAIAIAHHFRSACPSARLWNGHYLSDPEGRTGFADTLTEVFGAEVYRYGYEPHSSHTVLDLGANVGLVAAWLSLRAPGIRVFAYEPFPDNVAQLRRNVAPWSSISVHAEAIGRPGHFAMRAVGARSIDHQLSTEPGDIPVISLGEAITGTGSRVDLLKIDIEGSEADVFAEPVEAMRDVDHVAIEWHEHVRPGVLNLLRTRLSPTHTILRVTEDDPRYGMLYARRHGVT